MNCGLAIKLMLQLVQILASYLPTIVKSLKSNFSLFKIFILSIVSIQWKIITQIVVVLYILVIVII